MVKKRLLAYLGSALGCVAVTNIYAIFGHGVRSASMDGMFLYPLLGGILYGVLSLALSDFTARPLHRMAFNAYNSGIAALTVGGMLGGILEIAGTGSGYLIWFTLSGWALAATGLLLFLRRK